MLGILKNGLTRLAYMSSELKEQQSVFSELWAYFVEKYLTLERREYANIDMDYDSMVPIPMLFFGIFFAVMAGACVMLFTKRTLGRLVRRLISNEAYCYEKAKTLKELDLDKSRAISLFINRYTLEKAVRCVEEDEFYGVKYVPKAEEMYPEKNKNSENNTEVENKAEEQEKDAYAISINSKVKYKRKPQSDHFYIPAEQRHRAKIRFDSKGTNPMMLLILAVVYIVVGLLLIKFMPYLLSFIDGAIGAFKGM